MDESTVHPAEQTVTFATPLRLAARKPKVVVLGDVILDAWLHGHSDRLCREAPAPVVDITEQTYGPGGAANTAANLAGLGAETHLVGVTGNDQEGVILRKALNQFGVHTHTMMVESGRRTVVKRRVLADEQLMIRLDDIDRSATRPCTERAMLGMLRELISDCDALVIEDYGTGTLGESIQRELADLRDSIPLLVVDAHDVAKWSFMHADITTPNADEAAKLLGVEWPAEPELREKVIEQYRKQLLSAAGSVALVVTLDKGGSLLMTAEGHLHRTHTHPVPESQASGAGDTFVAALTVAVSSGMPIDIGVDFAQAAADVVVSRPGTSVCTSTQLSTRLGTRHLAVLSENELIEVVKEHKLLGRKIVFTNGCFDVLHKGHVAYLEQARQLGDVLVVAVNGDDSIKRLKGPDRPINPMPDRAAVLAALNCVDHVVAFHTDTPVDLLRKIRPHVYAKGGDYTPEMLPETPVVQGYGGIVRILDYVPDHSTTAVIDRIRQLVETGRT